LALLAEDRPVNSNDPISAIALSLRYESVSGFSTAFKRVIGVRPGSIAVAGIRLLLPRAKGGHTRMSFNLLQVDVGALSNLPGISWEMRFFYTIPD
jgi:AraC-like DNA-binding protein